MSGLDSEKIEAGKSEESLAEKEDTSPQAGSSGSKRCTEASLEEQPRKIPATSTVAVSKPVMDELPLHEMTDHIGRTPLHRMISVRDRGAVMRYLRAGKHTLSQDGHGRTPLHYALGCHDEEIAEFILDAGGENDLPDEKGRTPLHDAAEAGFVGVVRRLLRAGANTRSQDLKRDTPLHVALVYGKEAAAEVISCADPGNNLPNRGRWTPLHFAAEAGFIGVARTLLYGGVSSYLVDCKDCRGMSALEKAYARGHLDVVRLILSFSALTARTIDWGKVAVELLAECQQLMAECEEEVRRMKETKVGGGSVSYFDVVRRSASKVASWLASENVQRELLRGGFEGRFPNYAHLITHRVELARKSKDLNDRCVHLLSTQLPLLPVIIIERIMSYLSELEIQNFIDAFIGQT